MIGHTEDENEIEVKPRTIQIVGKGIFLVNIVANYAIEEKRCVRKILTFKIKDTNCYYHFPIEVIFYPSGESTNSVE